VVSVAPLTGLLYVLSAPAVGHVTCKHKVSFWPASICRPGVPGRLAAVTIVSPTPATMNELARNAGSSQMPAGVAHVVALQALASGAAARVPEPPSLAIIASLRAGARSWEPDVLVPYLMP